MRKIKDHSQFHLKLNSLNELNILLNKEETKIYEIVIDLISVNLVEHMVDKVVQLNKNNGRRYFIDDLILDFYQCDDCNEFIKKSQTNGSLISISYYFLDRELAENKLNIEKQKLIVKNLNLAFT